MLISMLRKDLLPSEVDEILKHFKEINDALTKLEPLITFSKTVQHVSNSKYIRQLQGQYKDIAAQVEEIERTLRNPKDNDLSISLIFKLLLSFDPSLKNTFDDPKFQH
mmetsp:Transcript_9375/g.14270  ORF Transcript_9375/g.14270 Transcript_9375/m.14270 type:complete len:108 (+) Transcript_9375:1472-1795(+)